MGSPRLTGAEESSIIASGGTLSANSFQSVPASRGERCRSSSIRLEASAFDNESSNTSPVSLQSVMNLEPVRATSTVVMVQAVSLWRPRL